MSTIPIHFSEVIKKIAKILEGKNYAFRGTSSLVIQGIDMNVDDIDILCDKNTALECNSLFSEFAKKEVKYSESSKYKSYFGEFDIDGIKVEVMGDWSIKNNKGDWVGPYDSSQRTEVDYEGQRVFVTTIDHELSVFASMGRWSAFHKIKGQIKLENNISKFLLIDTFNFLHRAYHALPKTFVDKNGEPVNAVYGFTSMLINVLSRVNPDYIVAAVDSEKATFRSEDFTAYKAHRKPTEDELSVQIPKVMEIIDAFGIKRVLVDGYEADDLIATVAVKFSPKCEISIVSNDKDLWQLAGKNIFVGIPDSKGELTWLGDKETHARMGFDPKFIADYKGLRGDPSDNIPGVYGVGEVTATKLIQTYGTLEDIYRHVQEIKPDALREKLLNSYEQALMSKKLAQLITDVPFQLELEQCKYLEFNHGKVKEVLEKYNFKSLIRRLGFEIPDSKKKSEEPPANQPSLF